MRRTKGVTQTYQDAALEQAPLMDSRHACECALKRHPIARAGRVSITFDMDAKTGTNGMSNDARLYAPSAARNRDAIVTALRPHLPVCGTLLEIASGSGEHIAHISEQGSPDLRFQPSDPDLAARASIDHWVAALGRRNVLPAIDLDAAAETWPVERADAVLCINMIHIAPWAAAVGLVRGAARVLPSGGNLFLYGPYRQGGAHTAPSNAAFDQELRARNAAWGVRDLDEVAALAAAHGFGPPVIQPMPANNLFLEFTRGA